MSEANPSDSTSQANKNKIGRRVNVSEYGEAELDLTQPTTQRVGKQAIGDSNSVQAALLRGPDGGFESGSLAIQTIRLTDPRLALVQRQTLAQQIGRVQGNQHLGRVLQQQAETTAQPAALIVEDDVTPQPGQMHKQEFLDTLRDAVCSTADEALSGTIYSVIGCPYITTIFNRLPGRPATYIERMIRLYAPEAARATSAEAYIQPITSRVRTGIANWLESGEVTGVPAGLASLGGEAPTPETGPINRQIDSTVQRTTEPIRIQRQLGEGRPLDSSVRSRMEAGFGQSLGDVTIHTDTQAAQLAREQQARAFTVGQDIVFGNREYQPGTLVGDAILAHELAHVMQQRGATASAPVQRAEATEGALEADANRSALGAVVSLWGGMTDLVKQTQPVLRSGLSLRRCSDCSGGSPTRDLSTMLRETLEAPGPVNHAGIISAIQAASETERRAVLRSVSLRNLITSRLSDEQATTVMASLLEGSQHWVNPPSNDFFDYFVTRRGTGTLPNTATMNCWEAILYAAYLAQEIDADWIVDFYTRAFSVADPNVMIWASLGFSTSLPRYPGQVPASGQLLFYYTGSRPYPGHVALSLGGDDAISLWNQPHNEYSVQRIKVTDLSGTVYIGDAPW